MIQKILLTVIIIGSALAVSAQETPGYQLPPAEIVSIVDAPQIPAVLVSSDNKSILLLERPELPSIADLSKPELRLAGIRFNPSTNGSSRGQGVVKISAMNIDGTNLRELKGMPADPHISGVTWSDDCSMFAFTNTTDVTLEVWVADLETMTARKIDEGLNDIFWRTMTWLPDGSIVYLRTLSDRGKAPEASRVPKGPAIQESAGVRGESPTFQDLIKNPDDERIFEYYATSELMRWSNGSSTAVGSRGMITDLSPSPDGQYLLITKIDKPFSYIVPFYYFPTTTQIWDLQGNVVTTLLEKPLQENLPRGYDMVIPGPRNYSWRSDRPATIMWVEALDEGDYHANEMQYHDQVYMLDAPFAGEPVPFIATEKRYQGIVWGNDNLAMLSEGLSKSRIRITSTFNPANPQATLKKIFEINADDRYNNPGFPLTVTNSYGMQVLLLADRGRSLYLSGQGASPEGDRPFIDKYDLKSGKTTRLWRSEAPYYETVSELIDPAKQVMLTVRQSVTEVPNYFLRDLKKGTLKQVTHFENPYPQLAGVHRELVTYKRNDGIDLSFMLYLPAGYDREKDGPLPTILWAYPREYNDPSTAGQISGSPYSFTRVSPSSVLVYVTQGYAILNNASFPIIGAEGEEPNDTFVSQLVANAEAAINKAVEMGVTDPERVAASGHSYGAFMTAHLLSHSRLFAAGIARSGAYNRSLTPFGFQSERRSFWEAPELYLEMSPFTHATKVKDPLLLIHGMADDNTGTFPIQSERYYAALKGAGATTRLVLLPAEAHGYDARESLLHMHWEYSRWLDKYVKNKK
ncbi:MAG: prolyl oligopeptidase family serine peptidase [Bacteroidales bacterium]|jgi:dipeptidyl aminopeptidase/acylaminoacyl peptidase|nr:prolyl oligopeptidase family serine peptidase [Bacteroidales bacterium]